MIRRLRKRARLLVCICGLLLAGVPAAGQDLSGVTICIDPGHGKGSPNAGPTGLREADINLTVAKYWRELLQQANADTVLLTRENDAENPSLSQREQIANAAGVAWFHSTHHNATGLPVNTTIRYTLLLYEELAGGQPQWPGLADAMSQQMATRLAQALRTSDARVFGDFSFYGTPSYLGVLNDLQMPGQLSEATFHDNRIEENKLRNDDFLRLEATALHMAFLDYFDAGTLTTGSLSGIMTDRETGTPINGVTITLQPGDQQYTTDNWGNGLYIFHNLPPGSFTITASKAGYDTARGEVVVRAHAFAHLDLALVDDAPPVVTANKPENGEIGFDVHEKLFLRFSRPMDVASLRAAFSVQPAVEGELKTDARREVFAFEPADRFAFGTNYTVTIADSARDAFGRRLDGDGDPRTDEPYQLQFRTVPIDTSFPLVVDFYPRKNVSDVFLREILHVRFNRPIDVTSLENNRTVFAINSRGHRAALRLLPVPGSGGHAFDLMPETPWIPGIEYTVTLTKGITDRNGVPMLRHFTRKFATEDNEDQWDRLTSFTPSSVRLASPLLDPSSFGLIADSVALSLTTTTFLTDSSAQRVRLLFNRDDGRGRLRFTGEPPAIGSQSAVSIAVHGDSSMSRIALLFENREGVAFLSSTPVDWRGWRVLAYVAGRDSLETEFGGGGLQFEQLRWQGIEIAASSQRQANLVFDEAWVRLADAPVAVQPADRRTAPSEIELRSFPNPMRIAGPGTRISFTLQEQQGVSLAIFDILGRQVAEIVDQQLAPGRHVYSWDGNDFSGQHVPAGIYFIRLRHGAAQTVIKLLITQ